MALKMVCSNPLSSHGNETKTHWGEGNERKKRKHNNGIFFHSPSYTVWNLVPIVAKGPFLNSCRLKPKARVTYHQNSTWVFLEKRSSWKDLWYFLPKAFSVCKYEFLFVFESFYTYLWTSCTVCNWNFSILPLEEQNEYDKNISLSQYLLVLCLNITCVTRALE